MSDQQRRQRPATYEIEESASIAEIAAELGCTHQRASQVLASALRKCREALAAKGVTKTDDLLPD